MRQQIAADPDDEPSAGDAAPAPDADGRKAIAFLRNRAEDWRNARCLYEAQTADWCADLIAAQAREIAVYRQANKSAQEQIDRWADRAERAEADLSAARADAERMREALVAAAKAMYDECLHYASFGEQPPQHLLDAVDAARSAARKGDV